MAIINQGKVWAYGKLTELYEKYAVGIVRISTDNPEALASEIAKLNYIEKLETDFKGISVRVTEGREEKLYENAPKLAKKIKAKILGIETGSASLEELYGLAVGTKEKE